MATLLGPDGRPITTKTELEAEVARPSLTGVRQAWPAESMVAGLTPDRLDAILRQANQGDMDAFLTLAEEMEERDPHYGSVLQTRKLAVMGLERQLVWSKGQEDDPLAEEIHDACSGLIDAPCFEDLLHHLLDAIAKGYAAPEILWDTSGNLWRPKAYEWRDPRWFQFDRETGRQLRLKESGRPDGAELPKYKFAVHLAGRKSGLAARGGLARLVAFSFVCKLYGVKDWMAYAEIFGIPLRLGKYDAAAKPEDVEVLKRAVFGLGSDAAAVIPEAMTIEFPVAPGANGAELFMSLASWIDNQVSKAVLGQTGTTDMQRGGGFAQSKVLNEVRGDLTKADAKSVAATVTSDILAPFVAFNWGPAAPVPGLVLVVEEPEDVDALSTALERLVPLGLKVSQAEVRKKLKISEPDDDEDILAPPAAAAPPPPEAPGAPPTPAPAEAPQVSGDPARARLRQALARNMAHELGRHAATEAELQEIQIEELQGWSRTFGPEAGRVVDLVRQAESFEAFTAGLEAMAADLAAPAAARSLARAMFQAAVIGEGRVRRAEG